jgi:hypothetical protein
MDRPGAPRDEDTHQHSGVVTATRVTGLDPAGLGRDHLCTRHQVFLVCWPLYSSALFCAWPGR